MLTAYNQQLGLAYLETADKVRNQLEAWFPEKTISLCPENDIREKARVLKKDPTETITWKSFLVKRSVLARTIYELYSFELQSLGKFVGFLLH